MKKSSIIKYMAFVVVLVSFVGNSRGQSTYSGALQYYIDQLKSVPTASSGEPSDIQLAYLRLDKLLRMKERSQTESFLDSLSYGDTLKFFAKMLYRIVDDNPIMYMLWSASASRFAYKTQPDLVRGVLQTNVTENFRDWAQTGQLLQCDIIADVKISDTVINENLVPEMAVVFSTIMDPIKGKKIPSCPPIVKSEPGRRFKSITYYADVDTAAQGQCLAFEYCPEWSRTAVQIGDDVRPFQNPLTDGSGWWIKPDSEYIVFLYLRRVDDDSSTQYFTVYPLSGSFGTQGAMYRVQNGHVVDPNDDFNLGGRDLPVEEWKARLRARIKALLDFKK